MTKRSKMTQKKDHSQLAVVAAGWQPKAHKRDRVRACMIFAVCPDCGQQVFVEVVNPEVIDVIEIKCGVCKQSHDLFMPTGLFEANR